METRFDLSGAQSVRIECFADDGALAALARNPCALVLPKVPGFAHDSSELIRLVAYYGTPEEAAAASAQLLSAVRTASRNYARNMQKKHKAKKVYFGV